MSLLLMLTSTILTLFWLILHTVAMDISISRYSDLVLPIFGHITPTFCDKLVVLKAGYLNRLIWPNQECNHAGFENYG